MDKRNIEDLFEQLRELHSEEEEEILAEIESIVTEEDEDYYNEQEI